MVHSQEVVVHAFNSSNWEAEAGESFEFHVNFFYMSELQDCQGYREALPPKQPNQSMENKGS